MRLLLTILLLPFAISSCAQAELNSQTVALDDSLQIAVIQVPKGTSLDNNTSVDPKGNATNETAVGNDIT